MASDDNDGRIGAIMMAGVLGGVVAAFIIKTDGAAFREGLLNLLWIALAVLAILFSVLLMWGLTWETWKAVKRWRWGCWIAFIILCAFCTDYYLRVGADWNIVFVFGFFFLALVGVGQPSQERFAPPQPRMGRWGKKSWAATLLLSGASLWLGWASADPVLAGCFFACGGMVVAVCNIQRGVDRPDRPRL